MATLAGSGSDNVSHLPFSLLSSIVTGTLFLAGCESAVRNRAEHQPASAATPALGSRTNAVSHDDSVGDDATHFPEADQPALLAISRGMGLMSQGRFREALAEYNEAIAHGGGTPAILERGRAKYGLHDYDGAIADFTTVLASDPSDADAFEYRAAAYDHKNDLSRELEDYNRAIALRPSAADLYGFRAEVRYRMGDYRGAVADENAALRISPTDADEFATRANAELALGDTAAAIAD